MNKLRTAVSGPRHRYKEDGFDLDLSYITPRIIAMGFPGSGFVATFRNNIEDVQRLLDTKHGLSNVMVFNLSEKGYDYGKFGNQVLDFGFPDHHAAPLEILWNCCQIIHQWLESDKDHVIAIHCLAGKGRTGLMISSYLMFCGVIPETPDHLQRSKDALEFFSTKRGDGVTYSDQKRFCHYFAQMLERAEIGVYLESGPVPAVPLPPARELVLHRIVLHGTPIYDEVTQGCRPIVQISKMGHQGKDVDVVFNGAFEGDGIREMDSETSVMCFNLGSINISGDVEISMFHAIEAEDPKNMFRFCFHTSFVSEGQENDVLRISLKDIDIHKRKENTQRYPESFMIDIMLEDGISEEIDESEALASHEDLPEHSGWMVKRGGFIKSWQKRFFRLKDGYLVYAKDKSSVKYRGRIDLRKAGAVYPLEKSDPKSGGRSCLALPTEGRTFLFETSTDEDMMDWVKAISKSQALLMLEATQITTE
eukprot:TRINITY_DN776190_c0_g1_i1.p1 TRINITY_DN776190_c0_g1~~TRINITY_DN776190_c0_g1_i1.p1  ORF type:complete len:478 (-),score=98.35 TRINITY_DN776190_c0_g1_i1:220-1653(-)